MLLALPPNQKGYRIEGVVFFCLLSPAGAGGLAEDSVELMVMVCCAPVAIPES